MKSLMTGVTSALSLMTLCVIPLNLLDKLVSYCSIRKTMKGLKKRVFSALIVCALAAFRARRSLG